MNRKERRQKKWDEEFNLVQQSRNDFMRECMPEEYFRKKVARLNEMQRNGITVEMLKANYDLGYKEGFQAAAEPVVRGIYAAVCLALNDLHGFGQKRCADVLRCLDDHLTYTLTSTDLIDDVWERMGLKLEFKEPFDRIQEV